jgi:hypothetical protein
LGAPEEILLLGIIRGELFNQLQFCGNLGGCRLILLEEGIIAGIDIPGACPPGPRPSAVDIGQGGLNVMASADPALRGTETDPSEVRGHSAQKKQNYSRAKRQLGSRPLRHLFVHRSLPLTP